MRVLYLAAYFSPENIAFSHLEKDIIEALILNEQNEVFVVCPTPSRGISADVYEQYKNKKHEALSEGRLVIQRFKLWKENKSLLIRALRYLICAFKTYRKAIKLKDIDIVFAVSTPPIQGLIAARVAKKMRCKSVYCVQDVFPESAVNVGLLGEKSLLTRIGYMISKQTYSNVDTVITIADDLKTGIEAKYALAPRKVNVVENWIDTTSVHYISRSENTLFDELKIDREGFLVVYAGNIGKAQNLNIIIEAAKKLAYLKDIVFIVVGDGSQKEEFMETSRGVSNIKWFGMQKSDRVSEVYSMGDVCVVPCKAGIGKVGIPSKVYSIMACERPIIMSFDKDTSISKLIDGKMGFVSEPDDIDGFTENICVLYKDKAKCKEFGLNAREYVLSHASKEVCTASYLSIFEETVGSKEE